MRTELDLKAMKRQVKGREPFEAGDVIFTEGEDADKMYLVIEGQVRLTVKGESMSTEVPGGIIGEMALIDSGTRSATATAITDCTLAPIDQETFVSLLQQKPEFSLHVMSVLADRLRLANDILAAI